MTTELQTVDPVGHLRGHRSSISSICFIRYSFATALDSDSCLLNEPRTKLAGNEEHSLGPQFIASCDTSGDAYLWNTASRRIIAQFGFDRRESGQPWHSRCQPGLCLRSLMPSEPGHGLPTNSSRHFMYHTRGIEGIVSVLDVENLPGPVSPGSGKNSPPSTSVETKQTAVSSIFEVKTWSSTFCAASPCRGDVNLLVAPSEDECVAKVYDIRIGPYMPAMVVHGAGRPGSASRNYCPIGAEHREHGMLTSVSMSTARSGTPILACGMESGEIFFHDCRALRAIDSSTCSGSVVRGGVGVESSPQRHSTPLSSIQLSRDPVLALDLFESFTSRTNLEQIPDSVIAIGGCAGSADLCAQPASDGKPGAVVKASFFHEPNLSQVKIRRRFMTCEVGENATGGKPGISCCRFRDDGKLFAVGGWDHRARIFSKKGVALAILKGHTQTVTAVDWSADLHSGLFASGSSDGKILLWRLFPSD